MSSGHADGHRIKMVPWFSLTLDSFFAKRPRSNMSKTCPRTHLRCGWVLENRRSHPVSNFQLVIFQEFSAAEQKRRANAESRSIQRWRDGAMVNPKEMQNGIGEWMSTCFGIVDSYNLLYRCSFVFFAKLFYKRCWPILLFWGRGMTCFCASMTSWSQQQQWLLDPS